MSELLKIGFAIVVGILVTALLHWLAPKIPYGIDILLGVVGAFIAYHYTPSRPTGL